VKGFVRGLLELRRGAWEAVATALILTGVAMFMQGFALALFTYSFAVTLTGTLLYVIVSHFRE
jgi:hypothetical protein